MLELACCLNSADNGTELSASQKHKHHTQPGKSTGASEAPSQNTLTCLLLVSYLPPAHFIQQQLILYWKSMNSLFTSSVLSEGFTGLHHCSSRLVSSQPCNYSSRSLSITVIMPVILP